jgi:hypothetical protein
MEEIPFMYSYYSDAVAIVVVLTGCDRDLPIDNLKRWTQSVSNNDIQSAALAMCYLANSYWASRVWTAQEIRLAKKITFACNYLTLKTPMFTSDDWVKIKNIVRISPTMLAKNRDDSQVNMRVARLVSLMSVHQKLCTTITEVIELISARCAKYVNDRVYGVLALVPHINVKYKGNDESIDDIECRTITAALKANDWSLCYVPQSLGTIMARGQLHGPFINAGSHRRQFRRPCYGLLNCFAPHWPIRMTRCAPKFEILHSVSVFQDTELTYIKLDCWYNNIKHIKLLGNVENGCRWWRQTLGYLEEEKIGSVWLRSAIRQAGAFIGKKTSDWTDSTIDSAILDLTGVIGKSTVGIMEFCNNTASGFSRSDSAMGVSSIAGFTRERDVIVRYDTKYFDATVFGNKTLCWSVDLNSISYSNIGELVVAFNGERLASGVQIGIILMVSCKVGYIVGRCLIPFGSCNQYILNNVWLGESPIELMK